MMKKKVAKTRTKITTIEGLAVAMAEGFTDVHEQLAGVHERLDRVDSRLDRIEEALSNLDHRLTAVESKVLGIQRRLDDEAMERVDVRALIARMDRIEEEVFGKKQR